MMKSAIANVSAMHSEVFDALVHGYDMGDVEARFLFQARFALEDALAALRKAENALKIAEAANILERE